MRKKKTSTVTKRRPRLCRRPGALTQQSNKAAAENSVPGVNTGVGCRLLVGTAAEYPRQRPVPIEASACCEMLWAAPGAMLAFMGDPYASAPGETSGLNCA